MDRDTQAKTDGRADMARVVRHRLRNIAAGIRSAVQLLDEETADQLDPGLREYFPLIVKECDSLCDLAGRFSLYFDRTLSPPGPEPVALLTTRTCTAMAARFSTVEITREGTGEGDVSGWAEAALAELVCNACEAAPQGHVTVCVENRDGHACWTVMDSGSGPAPADRRRCFYPFYTTRPRHLGLGLPLARTLAQRLGGTCVANALPDSTGPWTVSLTCPLLENTSGAEG